MFSKRKIIIYLFLTAYKLLNNIAKFQILLYKNFKYFSGSIIHNDDIKIIAAALRKKYVRLFLVGEIDVPDGLRNYSSRIIKKLFRKWKKFPELIVQVDIKIAPLKKIPLM